MQQGISWAVKKSPPPPCFFCFCFCFKCHLETWRKQSWNERRLQLLAAWVLSWLYCNDTLASHSSGCFGCHGMLVNIQTAKELNCHCKRPMNSRGFVLSGVYVRRCKTAIPKCRTVVKAVDNKCTRGKKKFWFLLDPDFITNELDAFDVVYAFILSSLTIIEGRAKDQREGHIEDQTGQISVSTGEPGSFPRSWVSNLVPSAQSSHSAVELHPLILLP